MSKVKRRPRLSAECSTGFVVPIRRDDGTAFMAVGALGDAPPGPRVFRSYEAARAYRKELREHGLTTDPVRRVVVAVRPL